MAEGAPAPVYLLAGSPGSRGGKDALLSMALAASASRSPRVAYVGAPSDDNRMFFRMLSRMLRAAGAGRVDPVRLTGRNPDLAAARASVEAADVVFITGGDVERGMQVMGDTGFTAVLNERRAMGVPFLGVSAGSIALARRWIRWADPNDDGTATLFDCLGFAPIHCDTHGEEDGWPELRALLGHCPEGTVGYGIPTGCALRATGEDLQALGGPIHRFLSGGGSVTRMEDMTP